MFYDSGASRTVIQTESPLRPLLTQVQTTFGAGTVGSGVKLPYVESGILFGHNPVTVVDGLQFDLYSAVASAKKGTSAVIDFDLETGENKSFTFCKHTGEASSLMKRKPGVLEIPMHLTHTNSAATGLVLGETRCQAPPRIQAKSSSNALVANTPVQQTPAAPLEPNSTVLLALLLPSAPSNGILRPYHVSAFWCAFDTPNLSLQRREDN
jgi:hypothetical protein